MLVAVAAASPDTTSLSLMKPCANTPVSMVRRENTPAILAMKIGDASAIRRVTVADLLCEFSIVGVVIFFLSFMTQGHQRIDAGRVACRYATSHQDKRIQKT